MRRVPVVVAGSGPLAAAFAALVERVASDHAGNEGFLLTLTDAPGPEPSVVADCGGGFAGVVAAVRGGHAAVTADLAPYVRDTVTFAVLRADRRLGLSGALLPGLPLAGVLTRCRDTGDAVRAVTLTGNDPEALGDEAVAVAALLGVEVARDRVRTEPGPAAWWQATVGDRFPVVAPAEPAGPGNGTRAASVTTDRTALTLAGAAGGPDVTAGAMLGDLLAFAREEDKPWRVHRRRVAHAS